MESNCTAVASKNWRNGKVLLYFNKIYKVMNDVEKRQLMESLVSEIQIFEDRQPSNQWLRSIKFRLTIIEEDMEVSLDEDEHIEICLVSQLGTEHIP